MDGTIDVEGELAEVVKWGFANQQHLVASGSGNLANKVLAKVNKRISAGSRKKDIQIRGSSRAIMF